ncbi:hypothetical protein Y1Q_0017263 [Alligator mississippiensis]|uniref:Uncharacterized protein n=1 Tax=Alligator mississippiensis TaxID=8496 RepID=A0A151NKZ0_ALLMI|nr:hypothetical protein Y1Q_0017263 [Alligator mississippiensis]
MEKKDKLELTADRARDKLDHKRRHKHTKTRCTQRCPGGKVIAHFLLRTSQVLKVEQWTGMSVSVQSQHKRLYPRRNGLCFLCEERTFQLHYLPNSHANRESLWQFPWKDNVPLNHLLTRYAIISFSLSSSFLS